MSSSRTGRDPEMLLPYREEDVKEHLSALRGLSDTERGHYVLHQLERDMDRIEARGGGSLLGFALSLHAVIALLSESLPFRAIKRTLDIEIVERLIPPELLEAFSTTVHIQWFVAQYVRFGRRLYEVSAGLSHQLEHTEVRGLTGDDIRLPYPCVHVRYPGQDLQIWDNTTGWHRLSGITFAEDHGHLRVIFSGDSKDVPGNDANNWFELTMDGRPLDQILEEESHAPAWENLNGLGPMRDRWREVFRWGLNCILYATWPDADISEAWVDPEAQKLWERLRKAKGTKREKLKEQLRRTTTRKYTVLGRRVTVREAKEHSQSAGGTLMRVLVAGHWHTYWTGKGRTVKTRKFVEPFWRGAGEVSGHTHRLV